MVPIATVLVTGAGSGIGRATALAFSRAGHDVTGWDVSREGLEATLALTSSPGMRVDVCDIADSASVDRCMDRLLRAAGSLSMAVNCAGIRQEAVSLADLSEDEFDRIQRTNLRGTWLCMRAEIRAMRESGGGAIVNVSSCAALRTFGGISAYTAAKHGVIGLTKAAAVEHAADGVRVNAVCPGAIDTPLAASAGNSSVSGYVARQPLGRIGQPEEVANMIMTLASPSASFVTGAILAVDGGLVA